MYSPVQDCVEGTGVVRLEFFDVVKKRRSITLSVSTLFMLGRLLEFWIEIMYLHACRT